MIQQILAWAGAVSVSIGTPALLLWYARDRRKDKAAAAVAEGTIGHQVDLSSVTAAEAHVALLDKVYAQERASYERRIEAAETRAMEAEQREARKHAELVTIREEMERLRQEIESLQAELHAATSRVSALLAEDEAAYDQQKRGGH